VRRVLVGVVVVLAAWMLPACHRGSDAPAVVTTCYPKLPFVGPPSEVVAGATVRVSSRGFEGCPTDLRRLRSYVLQLRRAATGWNMASGERLRTVRVVETVGSFETNVTVPARARPGAYYVSFEPAPGDDYDYSRPCDDTASCALPPPPNLIVVPSKGDGKRSSP
jgi:hypothetical protein